MEARGGAGAEATARPASVAARVAATGADGAPLETELAEAADRRRELVEVSRTG